MDREKVIKALQNCSVQNDVGCQCCPYFEERKTYGHEWCTTSMAQDTLDLLKEQDELLHKKHKDIDRLCAEISEWKHKYYDRPLKEQEAIEPRVSTAEQRCGHCNKVIEMDGWQSCPWCGKRIDWESWWSKNGNR